MRFGVLAQMLASPLSRQTVIGLYLTSFTKSIFIFNKYLLNSTVNHNPKNVVIMNKMSLKVFVFSLFLALGAMLGTAANSQTTLSADCSFCHYGEGCKATTLSNTCDPGPPCSNDSTKCTPIETELEEN